MAGKSASKKGRKRPRNTPTLEKVREELLARRLAIMEQVSDVHQSGNNGSNAEPGDLGDWATASFGMDVTAGILESESRELQAINMALERIQEGSYGLCEDCGEQIPSARLKAVPHATYCLECKMRQERQNPRGGGGARWKTAAPRAQLILELGDFDSEDSGEEKA